MKLLYFIVFLSLLGCDTKAQLESNPRSPMPSDAAIQNGYTLKNGRLYLITNSSLTEVRRDSTFTHPRMVMKGTEYYPTEGQIGRLSEGDAIDFDGRIGSFIDHKSGLIDPRINPARDLFHTENNSLDSLAVRKASLPQFPQVDYHMNPVSPPEGQNNILYPKQ